MVNGIKESGTQTNKITAQSKLGAEDGANVVQGAIMETEGIAKIMDSTNEKILVLSSNVDQGLDTINEVVKAIDEVSSIAEESSAASEETSSAIEEQAASSEALKEIAKNVQEAAGALGKDAEKVRAEAQLLVKHLAEN